MEGKASEAATNIIKNGDRLKVTVFREKDLTGNYQVDTAGFIDFPMIGKIPAAQMTSEKLQKNLKDKLASGYLVNPDIAVEILPDCNDK